MSTTLSIGEIEPLPGVTKALYRAAQQARLLAARTGTPLVFSKNGQVEKRWINREPFVGSREDFERYLNAVPDVEPPDNDKLS